MAAPQLHLVSDPRLIKINTDRLSRHAETQIRAQADPHLIAEYAQAMLNDAEFPPIVVFDDGKFLHIGDGWHRADARALAHAKRPELPNEILAEVRKGSLEDALRYAMRANHAHGKRLTEEDYGRAIQVALRHGLIEVERAKQVVPALMALIPGLSARWARECTKDYRAELVAKRNRLIAAMHADGKTQDEIAAELDVPQRTVSDVIARLSGNGATAKTTKPKPPPEPPKVEEPKPAAEAPKAPAKPDSEPAIQLDFTRMLTLLDDSIEENEDETGIVAGVIEEPPADDPEALKALSHIDQTLGDMFAALSDLKALEGRFSFAAVQSVHLRLLAANKFLTELAAYIHQRGIAT